MPLALAGFYLALANLIGFPAGLSAGLLSDRIGRKWLTIALFLGGGAAVAALALFGQPILVLAAVICYGLLGKWTSDSILAAWMGDHVAAKFPSLGNSIYGLNNTARMLGGLLAPPITGALLDQTGTLATGFYIGSGVLFTAACLTAVVGQAYSRHYEYPA
jgi:MFS family permease